MFSRTLSCWSNLFNVEREDVLQGLGHTSNDGHIVLICGGREDVLKHFAFGLMSRKSLPLPLTVRSVKKTVKRENVEKNQNLTQIRQNCQQLNILKRKRTTRSHQRCQERRIDPVEVWYRQFS